MFDWDIIGNENIVGYLKAGILNHKLSHAYLFWGPKDIGKNELVKDFCKTILCYYYHEQKNEKKDKYPCQSCIHCFQFEKNIHPDIYFVKREINEKTKKLKQNISIDQIRDVQEKLNKKAFLNIKKIAIIEEAEYLTEAANNSLLKTLEEPKSDTILILISAKQDFILPTVISRCQVFKLKPAAKGKIYDYLVAKGATRDYAKEIANLSLGKTAIAKKIFFQKEELERRNESIGILLKIISAKLYQRMDIIEHLVLENDKNALILCLDLWQTFLRDILLCKLFLEAEIVNQKFIAEIKAACPKIDIYQTKELLDKIAQTKSNIEKNVNISLALETLALDIK
jgi:DNA polymerase III subunit delta'